MANVKLSKQELYDLIQANPNLSAVALAKLVGLPRETVRNNIYRLLALGAVERIEYSASNVVWRANPKYANEDISSIEVEIPEPIEYAMPQSFFDVLATRRAAREQYGTIPILL